MSRLRYINLLLITQVVNARGRKPHLTGGANRWKPDSSGQYKGGIMAKNRCACFHCLTASGKQKKFDKEQGKDKQKYIPNDLAEIFPWLEQGVCMRVKE